MREIVLTCQLSPAEDREGELGILRAFDMNWVFLERTTPGKRVDDVLDYGDEGQWLMYQLSTDAQSQVDLSHIAVYKRNVERQKVGPVFFHVHELYETFLVCGVKDESLAYFRDINSAKNVVEWMRGKQEEWHDQYHAHRAYCTDEEKAFIKEKGAKWHEVH
jgi:hypothetical protein